jgi:hypothetical protein
MDYRDRTKDVFEGISAHFPTQYAGVGGKTTAPQAITQHHHGILAGYLVFFRQECSSQRQPHSDHGEIIPRDKLAPDTFAPPRLAGTSVRLREVSGSVSSSAPTTRSQLISVRTDRLNAGITRGVTENPLDFPV